MQSTTMITTLPFEIASTSAEHSPLPHVLLVLDQFPKTLGGGERIVLRLASLLPQYGYRASILTFAVHPECVLPQPLPCPVYLLPLQRTYDLTAFRAAFAFRRFLKQQRIQIVQTFFESSDIWAGFVTRALSSARLIWSRRDMGILRTQKHHAAYRLMAGTPHAVFAVSEQVRRHCIEVDKVAPARVHTIYNGLNLADWNMANRTVGQQGEVRIGTIGNIRRVKGHDVLIRAASMLSSQYPAASFSIAGEVLEPDYFQELQTLVRETGLSERFRFAGGVANLRKYLAECDMFVLPSRSEGFSNAIVEAMASGLPVIATSVGGNAEAVLDGVTGLVVPPDDPVALSEAMMYFISNPGKVREMGAAGRKRVMEVFTTEAMMSRTVATYDSLLNAKAPHAG